MALKNKLLVFLAILLSCCLIALLSLASWINSSRLEDAVSCALSQELKHQITIGEIKPGFFNQIIVKNVKINLQGEEKEFAQAEEIRIYYSWKTFLTNFRHFPQGIKKIVLVKPQAYLERNQAGQWNYEQLFPKEADKEEFPADYLAHLIVDNGELILHDQQKQIKDLHLTQVQGSLNLRDNPQLNFRVQGKEGDTWLLAQGWLNVSAQKIDCKLQMKDFSVASWFDYLPKEPDLTVTHGIIDANLKVWGYYPDGLSYQGRATVADGRIKSQSIPLPISQVRGNLEIGSNKIVLKKLEGFLGTTPLQLMGSIYLGQETFLDLDLSSPEIMVDEISKQWLPQLKEIKKKGQFRGQIAFLGPLEKIKVQGQFYLTKGHVYGQQVKDFQLNLTYQDNHIQVEKAETIWQGGKLKAQGAIDLAHKKINYSFSVLADNLPVHSLPIQNQELENLKGNLQGRLLISSINDNLKVGGFVQLDKGSYRKMDFSQAKAYFTWEKGGLDLKYLVVDGSTVAGRIAGKVGSDNQIDLQIDLPVLKLNRLAEIFSPGLDLKGRGSFKGTVTGNTADPFLEGDFTAYQGRVLQQDFEELVGKISWADNKLNLDKIEMRDGITRHQLSGDIALATEPIFNLTLESKETRVEKLLRLANWQQTDFQGRVNSLLTIQGSSQNLIVQGSLDLTKGSWKDEYLNKAKIKFNWKDNLLTLEQLEAQQGPTFLTGRGWMNKTGEGELVFNIKEVDLEKVPYLKYKLPPGSKTVNLLGKVFFNAQKELRLAPLIIVHGRNSYRLAGRVDLGRIHPTMDLTMTIERGDLTLLSALIPSDFPHGLSGELQGKVNLWGRIDHPSSRAMLTLKKGSIGQYPIEEGKMDLLWKDDTLSILQFKLSKGSGFIAAQGRVNLEGEAQVDLVAQGLEGKLLSALFNSPEEIRGIVNLTAQVRGKTASPRIACSLEAVQGEIRETTFDRLYGLGVWEKGVMDLQQVVLKKDKYQLVAMGKIPTDLQSQQRINLKVKMEQGDLGLLTIFLDKQIDGAEGNAQAWLEIGGTLKAPLIKGEIKVDQGKILPEVLLEPIEGLEAHLIFNHDELELKYLSGFLGGGSFYASGKGESLFSVSNNLDFQLSCKNLKPKSKLFQGLVSGDLTLTGPIEAPLLKGQLTLAKGQANIPLSMGAGEGIKSGLRLDIGMNIRDNLKVKAMVAELFLRGGVHLGGTLANPQLQGTLFSKKGTISYLEKKFRLARGTIEFKENQGIMPILDLEGKTRYKATTITLNVTGQPTDIHVNLSSDPALSEREILFLLTLGAEMNSENGEKVNLNEQLTRIAGESLPLVFLQGLEESLGRNLGLDELYLSQNIWKGPQVTLGKYLWDDKVYLNYTVNTYVQQKENLLGEEEKWYLEAQYKINKNLNLSYSRTSLGDNKIMLTTSISF